MFLIHLLWCLGLQFYPGRLKLDFESRSCTITVTTLRESGILSLYRRIHCHLHHRQRKCRISFWCLCPLFFPLYQDCIISVFQLVLLCRDPEWSPKIHLDKCDRLARWVLRSRRFESQRRPLDAAPTPVRNLVELAACWLKS